MTKRNVDLIIVGQGLSGSTLAMHAIQNQLDIIIVSKPYRKSATFISGGIMNPITGKRLVKTDNYPKKIKDNIIFYRDIEKQLNIKFINQFKLHKVITDPLSISEFYKKKNLDTYQPLLKNYSKIKNGISFIINPIFQLNTPLYLSGVHSYLIKNNQLIEDTINTQDIIETKSNIIWKDIQAKKIIFCDGANAKSNPFFSNIDWNLSKGHIIEFTNNDQCNKTITNTGQWCCPMGSQTFRFGSTVEWGMVNNQPTKNISNTLLKNLNENSLIQNKGTQLIAIHSGIRPVTKKRQPIAGFLIAHPNIGCINGLGSNGTIHAPTIIKDVVSKIKKNIKNPLSYFSDH